MLNSHHWIAVAAGGALGSVARHGVNMLFAHVFVGLLGGFTTFSSFMLDTLTLTHTSEHTMALSNVAGQTVMGLAAIFAGYYVATN